jgi:hypothetical protein
VHDLGLGWHRDANAIVGDLRVGLLVYGSPATASEDGAQADLVTRARLLGRRHLGTDLVAELAGGLGVAARLGNAPVVFPVGEATLGWQIEAGHAELGLRHEAQANLLLGETYLTDAATLRGGLPLGTRLGIAATAGLLRSRGLVAAGDEAVVWTGLGDAGLYCGLADGLLLGLRYQYLRQRGGTGLAGDVTTNTVLLSFELVLPGKARGMASPYIPPLELLRAGPPSPAETERE